MVARSSRAGGATPLVRAVSVWRGADRAPSRNSWSWRHPHAPAGQRSRPRARRPRRTGWPRSCEMYGGSPRLSPRSLGRRGPACPGCCHPVGRCSAHTSAAVRQHVLLRETEVEHGDCFGLAVETARSWRLSSPQLPSQDSAGCDNDGRSPQARLAADGRAEIQFDDVTRRHHPATQSLRRSGRSRGHAPWHLAAALGSPCGRSDRSSRGAQPQVESPLRACPD